MRICLIYDCLFPYTVGGAERWYRNLAERLAGAGHEVTYLTLRQWERGEEPAIPGVRVIEVGPRMALYVHGRRRIAPPLRFGAGVLAHLLRHGRDYDVVHTASFPYFSLLAAAGVRRLGRYELVCDWHEVWSAGVLARVPRARRLGRDRGAAPLRPRAPAGLLLLGAARAAPARGGAARRRSPCWRASTRARWSRRRRSRPSRSSCSPGA